MPSALSPSQQQAHDGLMAAWPHDNLLTLSGDGGSGKSTILRELHRGLGGALLTSRDLVDATPGRHPLALEDGFTDRLRQAFNSHAHVFLDDLHLLADMACGDCGSRYPRAGWLNAHLEALRQQVVDAGKRLVVTVDSCPPSVFHRWGRPVDVPDFGPGDYAFFGHTFLGDDLGSRLDYERIHRFATELDAHQWRKACTWLRQDAALDTDRFIAYLQAQSLTSNVDLEDVQAVALSDLRGVEDVVRSLETHIILPLENDDLTRRFGLKPKRGVLLLGPPGTGKTTVGRALAHRLRGKFFLIDGTFIADESSFYWRVRNIFAQAERNAPAVLFIDDSDVIFQGSQGLGLYRYLLTMLDGLESVRAGRVCIMMTAMEVHQLPPALLRSGRIELWLEMKLPDESARTAILRHHLADWPAEQGCVDVPRLAALADGFTGADLKRLAEDGKNLFGYDLAFGQPPRPATEYFLAALQGLRLNKQRYAEAETQALACSSLARKGAGISADSSC